MKVFILCLSLIFAWFASAANTFAQTPPNIVFIFSDDHAYQAISAYADPRQLINTPNIDRIGKEGIRFERCLVPNSICGPSRATVLTGKYSHFNGFPNNSNSTFDGNQETFPKQLQKAGYRTAIIGKWHLESNPTGFDHWQILPGQGVYYQPPMIRNGEKIVEEGYVTDVITQRSLEWLDQQDKTKPFLLMMQHKAPHREWSPAIRHLDHDKGRVYPEPETLFEDLSVRGKAVQNQDMTLASTFTERDAKFISPNGLTPEEKKAWDHYYEPRNEAFKKANPQGKELVSWRYQRYMHDYLGTIKSVDESVGQVLEYLDKNGLSENTIVIYASDQGFYLGEHGWFDKRWIFEESVRTPFLVRWPKHIKESRVSHDLVSTVDFAQTLIEIAGAEPLKRTQGRSLVPVFEGKTPKDWRKSFYYHYYEYPMPHRVRPHYGVVTERYKLIHFYAPDVDYWELYDLEKDPKELKSVYGQPDYETIQEDLKIELKRLRKELEVPDPDPAGYSGGRVRSAAREAKQAVILDLDFSKSSEEILRSASRQINELPALQGKLEVSAEENATKFDGNAWVNLPKTKALDPSNGPWSVRVSFKALAPSSMILARGGEAFGYAVWIDEKGIPQFTVNNNGVTTTLSGSTSVLNLWVTVDGVIGSDQKLHLFVDHKKQATHLGEPLERDPSEAMQVGADTGSAVVSPEKVRPFQGWIRRVELFDGDRRKEIRKGTGPKKVRVEVPNKSPNVVLIYADDLGYGDLGPYGNKQHRTPNLDRLAKEGIKLERFYVAQPVCSASRAALLTGCYPSRVGIQGALGPQSKTGLNPEETTLAEIAKSRGYATAAIGKWHLGDQPEWLPTRQGFDQYFGLPYSNDMWPHHPQNATRKKGFPPLPLYKNEIVIDAEVTAEDQMKLTSLYTERSLQFIRKQAKEKVPFFLYLAHSMPHVPLFVSAANSGKSPHGIYADVIEELDSSTGVLLAELEKLGELDNTIFIFASDNGPWLNYGSHAGSSGQLREGKGTVWEGGVRVPFLARWPKHFPQGTSIDQPVLNLDLLPTLAHYIGASLPEVPIDGRNVAAALENPKTVLPEKAHYFYYQNNQLQAVMLGAYKLYLPHQYRSMQGVSASNDGKPVPYQQKRVMDPELYHVVEDPSETQNLALKYPDKVKELLQHAEEARQKFGDSLSLREGAEVRPAAKLD